MVPVATWLIAHYGGRDGGHFRAQFRRAARFNARIEENVGGARIVQAFANEAYERRMFAEENKSYFREKIDGYRLMAISTASTTSACGWCRSSSCWPARC